MLQLYHQVVLIRDFNDILRVSEKSRGASQNLTMTKFIIFAYENNMIDIGYVGSQFTWHN